MNSFDFLNDLINTPSPSGFEEKASELWVEYVKPFVQDIKIGTYGNTFATINAEAEKTVMICSHIDEVGMMVNYINDDGFIYFSEIGGIDNNILPAQEVLILGQKEHVVGVIGVKPIHLKEDEEGVPEIHDLYIDVGATSKEQVLEKINIGDPIIINSGCCKIMNNRIIGRGLDDRIGAWCVAEVLKKLSDKKLSVNVCGALTIQEENGCYGATMSAYEIKPDMAMAIDVSFCTDVPGISKEKHGDVSLGGGPILSTGSSIHKGLNESLIKVANNNRIDIQRVISPVYTGTDADGIFRNLGGIPTTVISIPNRYMHTPIEMVQMEDLNAIVDLVSAWCQEVERI